MLTAIRRSAPASGRLPCPRLRSFTAFCPRSGQDWPGAPSPALIGALTDATAARVRDLDPAGLVDRTLVRRTGRALYAVVVAGGALVALFPAVMVGGWRHLLAAPPPPFNGALVSSVP